MEASPLTQQARPLVFQAKIVELYEALFKEDDDLEKSEGFWREFFLLKPDKARLRRILDDLNPDDLLHLHAQTQQLFSRAVVCIKAGNAPADAHALDTTAAFFSSVLTKKYTNPSSDIINVLAGLDKVDAVFTDFVAALDATIRTGRSLDIRQKACESALSIVSGAYQTSILSYFTHRDLFPALMKFIQESDTTSRAFEPFVLLGLLANYNKFEFQNPYRLRLDDFVNEGTIQKIIRSVGATSVTSRARYIALQDDIPEGWTLSSTLGMIGLGGLTPGSRPSTPVLDPEVAKEKFSKLPGSEAAILLATYDFVQANKLFCFNFVSLPAPDKNTESPIASFLSLTSYLLQHAYLSTRTSLYSYINLLIIRILVEDQVLSGESFLPSPASYDDLFYKIVETGETLVKFRDNYGLGKRSANSIETLISVSAHYQQLLTDGATGRGGKHLTSAQVAGVIKQGYETLSIQAKEGLDSWDKYREAEEKSFLKKIARAAVTDVNKADDLSKWQKVSRNVQYNSILALFTSNTLRALRRDTSACHNIQRVCQSDQVQSSNLEDNFFPASLKNFCRTGPAEFACWDGVSSGLLESLDHYGLGSWDIGAEEDGFGGWSRTDWDRMVLGGWDTAQPAQTTVEDGHDTTAIQAWDILELEIPEESAEVACMLPDLTFDSNTPSSTLTKHTNLVLDDSSARPGYDRPAKGVVTKASSAQDTASSADEWLCEHLNCGKAFRHRYQLKRALGGPGGGFTRHDNMKRHIATQHP
ncbi:hypothetical protein B7463_g6569, partial [Scytalidium lignicola]